MQFQLKQMMTMKMIKKTIALGLGLVMMGGTASFAQSLADAKKAIDAEQYQKATGMLKTLIASQAKNGDNYFTLGNVYLINEDVDSARAVYTNGVSLDPKNALNYVGLGHADLLSNNAASAKTNFDKAIDLRKKDYLTYMYIGNAYLKQAKPDYAAALPYLQKADELDAKDKDPETFIALADYYALQRTENSKAYPQYLRALDINPNLYRANVQIARMFKEAYSFHESREVLEKVIAADPNYGPAYRELAELMMQWSNFDPKDGEAKRGEALTNYKKYLDLTDKSFDSRYRYAQFLLYASDWEGLAKELATLSHTDANNPKTFIVTRMRGYSAIENKNYDQGVKFMNELFARKQDAARILGSDYLMMGKALQAQGNDSLAVVNIVKGVEMDTTKVEELATLAFKFYNDKKYGASADAYRKAISLNSTNPNMANNYYYFGLADYFKYAFDDRDGKNPSKDILIEADTAFSKVNQLAPNHDIESAYLFRARIGKMLDNVETPQGLAVPHYLKYIETVTVTRPEKATTPAAISNLIDAYNWLGSFYSANDVEKSKEYLNKTLALDPQNAYAIESLKILNAQPAAKKTPQK